MAKMRKNIGWGWTIPVVLLGAGSLAIYLFIKNNRTGQKEEGYIQTFVRKATEWRPPPTPVVPANNTVITPTTQPTQIIQPQEPKEESYIQEMLRKAMQW